MVENIFSLRTSALTCEYKLVGFLGEEALSKPYRFDIFVNLSGSEDLADGLGSAATLSMARDGIALPDHIHGIVMGVESLLETHTGALVRLTVEPRLALLGLTLHSRVFTDKKVPEVIQAVLEENGLSGEDVELRLTQSYPVEEHISQYGESDLAFISRWMEREGMYYFFEQGDKSEKLIITDDKSSHSALSAAPIAYHPVAGHDGSTRDSSFHQFRARKAVRPKRVVMTDYDYGNPTLAVTGQSPIDGHGKGEVCFHGDRFFTPADGARIAKRRAQEFLALQKVFVGRGSVFHLRPGHLFALDDHPIGWMNQSYLCVELRHHGNLAARTKELSALTGLAMDETYHVDLVAIDHGVQYRQPRATPWPEVDGLEAGVVDAAGSGEYAEIDAHGRYRVVLKFDENRSGAGKASTWIRMMQPHSGSPEGFHFPLRKGTEVMVGFLAGDPDRPFIVGAVPNAATPSPVVAANHTRNVIHTSGNNRLELEDMAGLQWITFTAPPMNSRLHLGMPFPPFTHYITLMTDGDALFEIGKNQDIHIGGHLDETVEGAVDETYSSTHTKHITGPQTTTVKGATTETYNNLQLTTVEGSVTEEYKAGQTTTVSGGLRLEVFTTAQSTTVSGGLVNQTYTGPLTRTETGATVETHNGTLTKHVTGAVTEKFDSTVTMNYGPVNATWASLNWTIPDGATITTPSFNLNVQNEQWLFLQSAWTTGIKITVGAMAINTYAIKFQSNVLNMGFTGAKVDIAGAALGATLVEISVNSVEPKTHGSNSKGYAFKFSV